MEEEFDAAETVKRAVDRVSRRGRFAELELSNGIVLSLKPVPPLLLNAINQEFEPIEPPTVYIEEKGREEENPNDPHFLAAVEKQEERHNLALNDLVLAMGTALKTVPEGYFRPEEDGWLEYVAFAAKISGKELKIDTTDITQRYLYWLRFYALETGADVALAQGLPMQLTGIREGEVEEVIDSFRRLPERGADTEGAPETIRKNGNSGNRANRRSRT